MCTDVQQRYWIYAFCVGRKINIAPTTSATWPTCPEMRRAADGNKMDVDLLTGIAHCGGRCSRSHAAVRSQVALWVRAGQSERENGAELGQIQRLRLRPLEKVGEMASVSSSSTAAGQEPRRLPLRRHMGTGARCCTRAAHQATPHGGHDPDLGSSVR